MSTSALRAPGNEHAAALPCASGEAPRWDLARLRSVAPQIRALAARHGGRRVWVFGSVARGDADARSDVDLVVEFEPGTSLIEHGALICDLTDTLGCDVDLVSLVALRGRFGRRVEAERIEL